MRIIGPPTAKREDVARLMESWKNVGRISDLFFLEIWPREWEWGVNFSIDPVGLIAQSYKETGGGRFQGRVPSEFYNPCGLKIRHLGVLKETGGDLPLAHQMFPNWNIGCMAHTQHVCAYAGWEGWTGDDFIVDPRYDYVANNNYRLSDWSQLGGKWAPSPTYGQEIEKLMAEIQAGIV